MDSLKRQRIAPTPRRVRQKLPALTRNPETGKPMDDKTIHAIFKTRCYDDLEDDPWQYLDSPSQDVLADELKPFARAMRKVDLAAHTPGAVCAARGR